MAKLAVDPIYSDSIKPSSVGKNFLPLPTINLWRKLALETTSFSKVGSGVGYSDGKSEGGKDNEGDGDGTDEADGKLDGDPDDEMGANVVGIVG